MYTYVCACNQPALCYARPQSSHTITNTQNVLTSCDDDDDDNDDDDASHVLDQSGDRLVTLTKSRKLHKTKHTGRPRCRRRI